MSDMSPRARALLRAGKSRLQPSEADRERLLLSLARRVDMQAAVMFAGAPTTVPPFRPTSTWSTWSKAVLGGAGLAVVAFALSYPPSRPVGTDGRSPAASASMEALRPVVAAAEAASTAPSSSSALLPSTSAFASPRAARPAQAARSANTLSEEVALLSTAESALNQRRAAEALQLLREHERRFPRGALTLERMAAIAQALCMLGRTSEADAQLDRIAAAYPRSPQEQQARLVCGRARPSPDFIVRSTR